MPLIYRFTKQLFSFSIVFCHCSTDFDALFLPLPVTLLFIFDRVKRMKMCHRFPLIFNPRRFSKLTVLLGH